MDRKEEVWKKLDEEIKLLTNLQRFAFTALIAVVVGTFNAEKEITLYVGTAGSMLLIILLSVLTIAIYRKIKLY